MFANKLVRIIPMAISPKRPRPPVSAEVQDLEVLQRRECYAPDLETVQGLGCCIARAIASGADVLVSLMNLTTKQRRRS